jgi:hypothetical protein
MVKIEKTVSIGNIITLGTLLLAAIGSYYTLDNKAQKALDLANQAKIEVVDNNKKVVEVEKSIIRLEGIMSHITNLLIRIDKNIDNLEKRR